MADSTVSFPDLALVRFLCNDPDQDAKSFLLTLENIINLSLGSRPTDEAARARYLFRKKGLLSSILQGRAAEWYADSINDAASWDQIRTNFMNQSGKNWSKLTANFAFAHNTSVSYTTGQKAYDIVFGTKPQVPKILKLGLLRHKYKQCKSEFCYGFQSHTYCENSLPNNSFNRPLRPQLSNELLKREIDFKPIYSSTYERCRQITSKSHEHRIRVELGRPISIGQKVLPKNHAQDLTKFQKLKQL